MKTASSQSYYSNDSHLALQNITTYEDQFSETTSGNNIFTTPPKILFVEDNLMLQNIFTEMLNLLGCKVYIAEDGYEAVSMANKKAYDLIFMDIGLPKLNGIEATKSIRSQEPSQHRNIIVALTAYGNSVAKKCEAAGINDFYTKPVLIDDLTRILRYWLPHLLSPNNIH